MANYIDNGKRQEQAVYDAHHILTHGFTSWHCWWHVLRRSGRQLPNWICGPHRCQITLTTASGKSGRRMMLRRCSTKITEKMHCLLTLVTLHPPTQFCLNQAHGVAPTTYRIGGCGWFGCCHASDNLSASACNVSLFSIFFFGGAQKILNSLTAIRFRRDQKTVGFLR